MNTRHHHPAILATITLFLGGALLTSGCAKDPSKDAPQATVGEAKTAAAAPAAPAASAGKAAPAATKPADPATPTPSSPGNTVALSGTIGFTGSKVTGAHDGVFKAWSGSVLMGQNLEGTSLTFSVDTASIVSDPENRGAWSEKLDGHLKSPDFFDVAKFPKATFKSTAIAKATTGPASHTMTGDLTMRGVTRSVSFPATVKLTGDSVSATAEFTIQRTQWGINYKGKADDLIRDGVVMKINVQGKS